MNPMNPTGSAPFYAVTPTWVGPQPPPQHPLPPPLQSMPPQSAAFWNAANVRSRLAELNDTVSMAKAMQKELEMLILMKEKDGTSEGESREHSDVTGDVVSRFIKDSDLSVEFQESLSLNAANAIMAKLRFQLEPFKVVTDDDTPWEEKSAVKRLADKTQKHKRNKLWRKRKRKRIAENLVMEREQIDKKDKEADEWRAREIAKDIAQRKVEKMKEIAKLKAKEEKIKLEEEFELVLMVEKLKDLRSIRVERMKKQGHFLPEEDDKFLERVRAAVEEEEHLSRPAADTEAARDAIANAEEYRKHIVQSHAPGPGESDHNNNENRETEEQKNNSGNELVQNMVHEKETQKISSSGPVYEKNHNSSVNLPMEFYHYYYGSNTDMGTLIEQIFNKSCETSSEVNWWPDDIETKNPFTDSVSFELCKFLTIHPDSIVLVQVRRTWDAYIRPGGSRIPGHWVQPPPPADEIWASYLVKSKPN